MALYRQIGSVGVSRDAVNASGSLTMRGFSGYAVGVAQEFFPPDYHGAGVGNFFDDAFKFVQHNAAILGMQVPRAAFLALVDANAFHYADKLKRALAYPDTHAKLQDLWERVGGQFSKLVEYIGKGAGKKPIVSGIGGNSIGVEPVSTSAVIIASAATIVAAIIPVIMTLLKKHNDPVVMLSPTGADGQPSTSALNILNNPVVIAAIVALGIYYLMD